MKKNIFTFAALAASAFMLGGCAGDEIAPENGNGNGGSKEVGNGVTFVVPTETKEATRTGAIEKDDRIKFVWTETDQNYLWCDVNQQQATADWQKAHQQYTAEVDPSNPSLIKSVSFVYPNLKPITKKSYESNSTNPTGDYRQGYYTLLYTGNSNNVHQVNIPKIQHQTGTAGYADKLGENGDCFVGYAAATWSDHKQSYDSQTGITTYSYDRFHIRVGNNTDEYVVGSSNKPFSHGVEYKTGHKASYLSFMVYNTTGAIEHLYVKKISVTVDNQSINGQLDFSVAGIDLTTRPNDQQSKGSMLVISDGLSIAGSRDDALKKAAVMVALPGEYKNMKVDVLLSDPITHQTYTIHHEYPKVILEEGRNLPLYYKLSFPSFSNRFNSYHMWGASLVYWNGVTTPRNWGFNAGAGVIPAPAAPNDKWPKSAADGFRWYDSNNREAVVGALDYQNDVPTANDVSYVLDQCYWDEETQYIYDGHLFTGMIWVPNITKGHTTAKNGANWRNHAPTSGYTGALTDGVHDIAGYFPLPALGYWENGALKGVGQVGRYWLWEHDPAHPYDNTAYSLQFDNTNVSVVHNTLKTWGLLSMPKSR